MAKEIYLTKSKSRADRTRSSPQLQIASTSHGLTRTKPRTESLKSCIRPQPMDLRSRDRMLVTLSRLSDLHSAPPARPTRRGREQVHKSSFFSIGILVIPHFSSS